MLSERPLAIAAMSLARISTNGVGLSDDFSLIQALGYVSRSLIKVSLGLK